MKSFTRSVVLALAVFALAACSQSGQSQPQANVVTSPEAEPLVSSGKSGLLGIPLPQGAVLISQTAANPLQNIDAKERYEISASAWQITSYYNDALPEAGWFKHGPQAPGAAFWAKGSHKIAILTNAKGGSFTLMGS